MRAIHQNWNVCRNVSFSVKNTGGIWIRIIYEKYLFWVVVHRRFTYLEFLFHFIGPHATFSDSLDWYVNSETMNPNYHNLLITCKWLSSEKLKSLKISKYMISGSKLQRYLKLLPHKGIYRNLLNFGHNNFKFYSIQRYPHDCLRLPLNQNRRQMDQGRTWKVPLRTQTLWEKLEKNRRPHWNQNQHPNPIPCTKVLH